MIAYGGEKMDASVAVLCVISRKIGERGGSRVCDTKFLISQRSYNVKTAVSHVSKEPMLLSWGIVIR